MLTHAHMHANDDWNDFFILLYILKSKNRELIRNVSLFNSCENINVCNFMKNCRQRML